MTLPTLKQLYEEVDAKSVTVIVNVGGVTVFGSTGAGILNPLFGLAYSFGFGKAPTATVTIPGFPPASVQRFNAGRRPPITISIGYNGQMAPVFSGEVVDFQQDDLQYRLQAAGKTSRLERVWDRVAISFNNVASSAALTAVANAAGLVSYVVAVPAWTIGTVVPQQLEFQTFGEMALKILEPFGTPWYEMPTGQARFEIRDPVPGPSAFRTYYAGIPILFNSNTGYAQMAQPATVIGQPNLRPRLRPGSTWHDDLSAVKNRTYVRGANIDTPQPDGSVVSARIEQTALQLSQWVPVPPGYNDQVIDNELLDTQALAASCAARYTVLNNRLLRYLQAQIDGDPQIFLGATVQVEDPEYLNVTGLWFVQGYSGTLDANDYRVDLDLVGGPSAGTSVKQAPVADFTWVTPSTFQPPTSGQNPSAKYQQMIPSGTPGGPTGGGTGVVVTFMDTSYDFDGQIVISSWFDNLGNTGTGPFWTHVYKPTDGTITVTHTVTDNDGLQDHISKDVKVDQSSSGGNDPQGTGGGQVVLVAMAVAATTLAMASLDGGKTWKDLSKAAAGAAGNFVSCTGQQDSSGTNVLLFGTDAGEIVRSIDGCTTGTVVYQAGVEIRSIWADTTRSGTIWAGGAGGILYRSTDDGLTWAPFVDLLDGHALNRLATPNGGNGAGSLFVYGGDSSDPTTLIRYNPNFDATFVPVAIAGALLAALQTAGGGHHIVGAASAEANDLAIIFDSGVTPRVWFTADVFGDGTGWAPATGLTGGLDGVEVAPGISQGAILAILNQSGPHESWSATDGVAYSAGGSTPDQLRRVFWEQGQQGVYVGAGDGGVVKSVDNGATWGYVRPNATVGTTWPGGALGRDITFFANWTASSAPAANLYLANPTHHYERLAVGGAWAQKADVPPANVRSFGYGIGGIFVHAGDKTRISTDQGETFTDLVLPGTTSGIEIRRAADGTLWLLAEDGSFDYVYTSTNNGASWTLRATFALAAGGYQQLGIHPTDALHAARSFSTGGGNGKVWFTVDGGANWQQDGVTDPAVAQFALWFWTQANRLIAAQTYSNGEMIIRYSDNPVSPNSFFATNHQAYLELGLSFANNRWMLARASAGSAIFLGLQLSADVRILRSVDQGQTFVKCNAGVPTGATGAMTGLAYDQNGDVLYALFADQGSVFSLPQASSRDFTTVQAGDWTALPTVGTNIATGDDLLAFLPDA